jgi:phosphate transport system substrate-binding protein
MQYQIVDPTITINYQSIGSGEGVKQFVEKTVDFGATDAPLSIEEEQQVSGAVVQIPETIGSVVAAYNIPGVAAKQLKLTGPILADIFLVNTDWTSPQTISMGLLGLGSRVAIPPSSTDPTDCIIVTVVPFVGVTGLGTVPLKQ